MTTEIKELADEDGANDPAFPLPKPHPKAFEKRNKFTS